MASGTALAAGIRSGDERPTRRSYKGSLVVLGLALLFVAAPALAADEAVYIWRDSGGVVRFSPVPQSEVKPEPVNASPVNFKREPPQGVAVSDAKGGRPY